MSSHSTALTSFLFAGQTAKNVPVCNVFMFTYIYITGCETYFFMTDEYGIFNVRTNLGACGTREGGSHTNKSALELTQRDRKTIAHPAPPWDQNQVFGLNSDALNH